MGFARMTALSAVTALVGASGLYATAAPVAGQERRVIIERDGDGPDRIIVNDGQDDAQDKGGRRVIVRKVQGGDGPGFDVFAMGGSRLGMVVRDVETADVTKEKLAGTAGAVVTEVVKESAAQKAGVKTGDVVTSFDGERVRSARQLERLVEETPAGRTVKVALQRAGAPVTLDVTPEAPKLTQMTPGMPAEGGDMFQLAEARARAGAASARGRRACRSSSRCRPGASTSTASRSWRRAAAGWASASRTCPRSWPATSG